MADLTERRYLGDGVYVSFDGYNVVVFTSDGITDGVPVYMEPSVITAFQKYINDVNSHLAVKRLINVKQIKLD